MSPVLVRVTTSVLYFTSQSPTGHGLLEDVFYIYPLYSALYRAAAIV